MPICSADGCNRTEPCGFACRDNGNFDKKPSPVKPAAHNYWRAELGFEIVKHEPEGQMPIYLVREDFADDREATITERVLWDALVGKTAASGESAAPRLLRDWCTDPDNCARCKAPQWDQHRHSHAGIPLSGITATPHPAPAPKPSASLSHNDLLQLRK